MDKPNPKYGYHPFHAATDKAKRDHRNVREVEVPQHALSPRHLAAVAELLNKAFPFK
jgi:hypothetical protein